MTAAGDGKTLDRGGVALGIGSYALWGLFPAFWPLLDPAAPPEVLAHRILWTTVLMTAVLTLIRGWRPLRGLGPRGWATVTAAAVFIAVNWGMFIYGVSVDLVVEAALGYYMSPLVSVLLGVVVLRERLGALQWVALGLGAAAVLVISIGNGTVPWLSMVLAASFGMYGLIKATVPLPAAASLTAEGIVLFPLAAVYVLVLELAGSGTFIGLGPWHLLLMLSAGPATALPLLLYGMSARRIPLSVLGVLMYLNPTLQFLWGVLVVGERMSPARWAGFGLIWVALAVFSVDLLRRTRRSPDQPVRSTA
ncbi:EamA family transporter RarD [Pseudonocardia sp. KRD291]|uniref:EamA family transporter RarD n=1 Tax=Pseudonocardia sp. KRD291 TaxID=2792007 RepID=UPI001C4A2CF1|nr:EamA family transporter RarD [Pseudonocardia sp. KRD291]MBW0103347.1 EamA family transporter RarD [Pseudonocardia sp. KRD291]